MQDLVVGFRSLRASPGYSLVVVLTVGLGIGATRTLVSFCLPTSLESSRSRIRSGWSR